MSKPWILFDRIQHIEAGQRIVTCKLISASDYFLLGHFHEHSIYPGVMLMEGIHQSVALLLSMSCQSKVVISRFREVNVRFLSPAIPGDQIRYEVTIERLDHMKNFVVLASGMVDGKQIIRYSAIIDESDVVSAEKPMK